MPDPAAKLTRSLNLVIPIETEQHGRIYIHSVPISRVIFEQHFKVLSKTFAQLFTEGFGVTAGPRVAYLLLKEVAEGMSLWAETQSGLLAEIVRLSQVSIAGEQGWQQFPLWTAYQRKILDEDMRAEIEGELVFFTCVVANARRNQAQEMMQVACGLWGSELTALDATGWQSSLPTSTPAANTGETPSIASVPR